MITKSDFLLYLEAPLHLWAKENNQLEKIVPTTYERHLMEQGKDIEELAKAFLQAFLSARYTNPEITWQRTFTDGHFQARVDALLYDPERQAYDIYEIKSSTSVKKVHKYDVTFQRLICEANIPVQNVYIVNINKEYVRQGEVDLSQLFEVVKVDAEIDKLHEEVKKCRDEAWQVVSSATPSDIQECAKPKKCPCQKLCHPELPEYPIYDLPRLNERKARDLKAQGILSISDIPEGYPFSDRQNRDVEAVKSGGPVLDIYAIQGELAKLEYPLYFLDYETYNPGVPWHDGYKPYQHMVFQYSLHVFETQDSEPIHYEYLAIDDGDPGLKLVEHLSKHIGVIGSVVVWNKAFESGRNKEMAKMYQEYSDVLLSINDRIFDLMEVFSKGYYVHPDFHGSASIKNVLPVLVQDYALKYDELPIPKGDEAMMAWVSMMKDVLSQEEVEQTKQDLLHYCELDTMAMVKNWEAIDQLVHGTS